MSFPPTPRGQAEVRYSPSMPSPGTPVPARLPIEDSYLELLADTLDSLDVSARGQFLQRYFLAITHLDLRESQCIQLWEEMLMRRKELSESLGRPVSLKTSLMDALGAAGLFRVPIIIEYEELKKLQLNAVTDPLTGLYNRRLFGETIEKEITRARRYALPLGLVILDLHRFKEVNDKHGHPRGDEVLRTAAATLRKALRTSDSAFRIGGDEFALLLPQTDTTQALALSRRVEAIFIETLLPLQLSVTVSMDHGLATFPADGEQAEELVRIADERLYHLKHANHGKTGNGGRTESALKAESAAGSTSAPKPIPIESGRAPERNEAKPQSGPVADARTALAAAASGGSSPVYAVQRKAERVSMAGTNAYAMLGEQSTRRARVLDLGFGGVAIELEKKEELLPDNILAVLHVPILPPVRVSLKPVWHRHTKEGQYRIGCAFVS